MAAILIAFAPGISTATIVLPPIEVTSSCADLGLIELGGVCRGPQQVYEDLRIRETQGGGSLPGGGTSGVGGTVKIGSTVMNAVSFASLMMDIESLTVQWALADIERFRISDGLHIGYMPGSVLDWRTVDWNRFGADNPSLSNLDVFNNMARWALGLP